jgi:hypothetical protein
MHRSGMLFDCPEELGLTMRNNNLEDLEGDGG